ncbi:MAG: type II 3-dehydroquinate dehydratase [Gammaproteobacteria bacterium]|nr:type II 3-dehydroquinate dehydratase [Gammaproteobacteria bacterium]NBT44326.1 type II 3-dehydroquinate dehydratase [Gammaproteobacteria bacterium]NBY22889.1 type II 3-dehydroquinate dehydratase [Gammaproteobacteria bacterium]NDE33970.1 type II 3-dehydroquinate dehydratase [Gammaproteobacteria bacterium]NDE55870.1 type II 3-dehydroquinate dehydratase [Gammaproteobacteria bacterium]
MAKLLVLNGPNLNLLGLREPSIYGRESLSEIETRLVESARQRGHDLECFQSNAESSLIDRIHLAYRESVDVILMNPGALTHTSIALRDAFLSTKIPFIEIHLSNVHAREDFRHRSYLSDIALGVILGLGPIGYSLALEAALNTIHLQQGQ